MSRAPSPITIREADTIWHEQGGWFDARWHFSFDQYRDPEQMGVGALRVFNDDRIIAGAEWPLHPHQDIESNTYVVSGHFLHADSLGNNGQLEAGAAQVMTFSDAGDLHSEKNGSPTLPLRFIQFWILPSERGLQTRVQQRQSTIEDRHLEHTFEPGRGGYLYVIDGRVALDGDALGTGDAAKITGAAHIELSTDVAAELILIDVPLEFEHVGVWAGVR